VQGAARRGGRGYRTGRVRDDHGRLAVGAAAGWLRVCRSGCPDNLRLGSSTGSGAHRAGGRAGVGLHSGMAWNSRCNSSLRY
jgi:hypothetical protein